MRSLRRRRRGSIDFLKPLLLFVVLLIGWRWEIVTQALGASENGCVCNAMKFLCSGIRSYGNAADAGHTSFLGS
jgi:hypothetical protein